MPTLDLKPLATGDDGHRTGAGAFDAATIIVGFATSQRFAFFRFPNATIPVGATIDVAHIVLTRTAEAGTTVLTVIAGVDEDNHVAPTTNAEWVTDHGVHTTATVTWDFASESSGTHQTPDISSVVQEIVDRAGWADGNAIGIHVDNDASPGSTNQTWEDFGAAGTGEAVLHIEYTEGGDTPATVSPGVIAQSFVLPAVGLVGAAKILPAVTARTFTVPQATASAGSTLVTPAAVVRSFALLAAAVKGGARTLPNVTARGFTVPAATSKGGARLLPNVVARLFTVPQATANAGGTTTTPASIIRLFIVPAASVKGAAKTTPSAIPLILAIYQASAGSVGGSGVFQEGGLTLGTQAGGLTADVFQEGGLTAGHQSGGLT